MDIKELTYAVQDLIDILDCIFNEGLLEKLKQKCIEKAISLNEKGLLEYSYLADNVKKLTSGETNKIGKVENLQNMKLIFKWLKGVEDVPF